MKVKVAFYGRLREVAGVEETEVRLDDAEPTVGDVADRLREAHPALADHLGAAAFAVGDRMVDPDRAVGPDEAIDVLPPVSGG